MHFYLTLMAVAAVDLLGDDPSAAGRWANSRKTMTAMYDVYRTIATMDVESPPPPITVHRLIQLCGGNDGVLPAVFDVVLGLAGDVATDAAVFEFSTSTVAKLLSEACPTAKDSRDDFPHAPLMALDERLTFADWYRFVLMCVRDCRLPTPEKSDTVISSISSKTANRN